MHLCFIKNEQVTRFQDEVSCSSLLENYVKTILLKDQTETHSLSAAHKKPKPRM